MLESRLKRLEQAFYKLDAERWGRALIDSLWLKVWEHPEAPSLMWDFHQVPFLNNGHGVGDGSLYWQAMRGLVQIAKAVATEEELTAFAGIFRTLPAEERARAIRYLLGQCAREDPFPDLTDPADYVERFRELDTLPGDPVWPHWGMRVLCLLAFWCPDTAGAGVSQECNS